MPSLPFLVAPKRETRVVSATINGEPCSIEFPVFGAITTGEEVDMREHEYNAVVYSQSSRLADRILSDDTHWASADQTLQLPADPDAEPAATVLDLRETEAQRLAIRIVSTRLGIPVPLGAGEQRLMLRHADLVAEVECALAEAFDAQMLRTVTAAIVHRLPGCSGWTTADTATLPKPLRQAISAFIDSERAGDRPQRTAEEMVDEMVDTLGKLGPEPSPSDPPTGNPSTGNAASSGPLLLSSAPLDSDASPSPTSSRRSKKANAG